MNLTDRERQAKTEALKQARALAKKYRDRWARLHAEAIADANDYEHREHERYYEQTMIANALPWEIPDADIEKLIEFLMPDGARKKSKK